MTEPRRFFQLAYVVDDLDAAVHRWIETAHVGPFFVRDQVRVDEVTYLGLLAPMELRVALCQIGDMQLELVQQTSDGPSVYRDRRPASRGGIHHLGMLTEDFDGELERYRNAGAEIVALGVSSGGRFAHVDTRASISCLTELIDRRAEGMSSRIDRYRLIAEAAEGWDGADPIRRG